MEPPQTEIKYIIYSKVLEIKQMVDVWFVHFEGSRESLNLGSEKPAWNVGDTVKITFKRTSHAKPSQSPE